MNIEQLRADYILSRLSSLNLKELLSFSSHYSAFLITFFSIVFVVLFLFIVRRVFLIRNFLRKEPVFLEITPPAFTEINSATTEQLFSVIHNLGERKTTIERLLGIKTLFSFEIVSTLSEGIRYLVGVSPEEASNIKRNILSYLPQVSVKLSKDYLSKQSEQNIKIVEFKLKRHFAYPLRKQENLEEHDPVAYITGMMTKLSSEELLAYQIVISPTRKRETRLIKEKILKGEDVFGYLNRILKLPNIPLMRINSSLAKPVFLTRFQQEIVGSVEEKIDQHLFETKIRFLVSVKNKKEQQERIKGFASSLSVFSVAGYQEICRERTLNKSLLVLNFKKRLLSIFSNSATDLLSVSEISALYHFPFTKLTRTENIVKLHSKDLPAPLSLKKENNLDVVFGKNVYGGTTTDIGLTTDERLRHMYIIGATGAGKTTMMFSMAKRDIEEGRGIGFIDPHGDVAEDLVASVPEKRKDDLIYVNPIDLKFPIGINLLELTKDLDEDDTELEKEVVAEGVISLFRKVFSRDEATNAHRIEYILRNTIYTAFTVDNCTIFTISKILTNPAFRKQVVSRLKDEELVDFWKYEFGKAGDFQIVKMTQGVTAKVGRFMRSPTAKRILEQSKSTINFDEIIDGGKILICNFSKGKIGEDTSEVLGILILTKIQLAVLRRARKATEERKPFYLYIDEFQNFATPSFIQMLSEARKFKLNLIMAEQSTSQQKDKNLVNVVLANVGTIVTFRSANPEDERLMLPQFAPYVEGGEISNLPSFHFYAKISALKPEEPFSGETIFIPVEKNPGKMEELTEASRKNWATLYKKESVKEEHVVTVKQTVNSPKTCIATLARHRPAT